MSRDTTSVERPGTISRLEGLKTIRPTEPSFPNRLPLKESLSLTGGMTIVAGSIALLAVQAFLTLLWFGYGNEPEAADATRLWREIALRDWMTRAITIASLVLRSIASLQVAWCTSMVAALILEKRSVRKSDVAYLSIARSISDGPRKVLQILFSSKSWSVLSYVELWLLCILALVALALQFASTLLLTDLHDFIVVGDLEARSIANFCTFDGLPKSTIWDDTISSPTYAIFGEEKSSYDIKPDANGFSDTGVLRRGHLPVLGSENRISVRRYRGSTLVTNSRIICVPPEMNGHFLTNDDIFLGIGHLQGTVNYDQSLQQAHKDVGPLCDGHGCEPTSFDCT
jgi:hypothetical protein